MRLGVTVPLRGVALAEHARPLGALLDAGYTDLWTQEVAGLDAFTPLAALAHLAPRARLGIGVAGVLTRGPALLAMQIAALAELAPGRCVVGLGTSSPTVVGDWNGLSFARPLTRLRETLAFLRQALAGERVALAGEAIRVRGFRLERPPATPPPLWLAALGPRARALALREADGVCFSLLGSEDVAAFAPPFAARRPEAERMLRVPVFALRDRERARALGRRLLAPYLNLGVYARCHAERGRGPELARIQAAWRAGDRPAAERAIPDAWVDALVVHGDRDRCREQLERFRDAGITTLVADVLAADGERLDAQRALATGG